MCLRMPFIICLLSWLSLWGLAGEAAAQQQPAPVAAAPPAAAPAAAPRKQLQAVRVTESIKLDGLLDEAAWQQAPVATDFIENQPTPGRPEKHRTEVRILYDDQNLYVGALMHDISPDSILRELSQRDDINNSDWFGIFLDTYHDKQNGYSFIVTSGGVQLDARYSPANGEDGNWNAVWDSRTALRGTDWVAELRIPYSAIRFAPSTNGVAPVWGLNFGRQRQITRQKYFWNELRPEVDGFVNQWGELAGLRDIKPPLRLSLTPYISGYVNDNPLSAEGTRRTTTSFNGGADVKWGINESFTLDATLVPDFGQVQSDNQVLNLSPFEVQFNENRQFFTEGTELFNKGNLFYSRRVGATPMGFFAVPSNDTTKIVRNPTETRLLNATKISGRTRKGLGVGLFNALSNDVYATVRTTRTGQEREVLTQPFSNYSILVLDQSLKNNSYVSLINTNVTRRGQTYDANVTGGLFRFADKKNRYAITGQANYSRRRGYEFGTREQVSNPDGYKYNLDVGKISGNFTYGAYHGIESDTYDSNDLGILFSNNSISQGVYGNYNIYKPFWKVNRLNTFFGAEHNLLYKPTLYQNANFYGGASTTFTKNFLSAGFNTNFNPRNRNYFEPRTRPLGEYHVLVPGSFNIGGFISTDYRKKLALDLNGGVRTYALDRRLAERPRRMGYGLTIGPRYRVNNHFNVRYETDWSLAQHQIGYVNPSQDDNGSLSRKYPEDAAIMDAFPGTVLLGRRRVVTVSNVLSAAYTFTNRMSFTIRTRHYTSTVRYQDFARLAPGGDETPVAYARNRDNTFNAFNVDAVYSWWFAPGSQVSIVWKNASTNFLQANEATPLYFDNLSNTINTPHNNNVSIKVLYFLDYLMLKPKRG
jgi:hypothetical protein